MRHTKSALSLDKTLEAAGHGRQRNSLSLVQLRVTSLPASVLIPWPTSRSKWYWPGFVRQLSQPHHVPMEDVPPSYESAVNRNAWNIIAPWIPSSDLCSASLVCRKWHTIFAPFLWGNPASHFGTENDAVYGSYSIIQHNLQS